MRIRILFFVLIFTLLPIGVIKGEVPVRLARIVEQLPCKFTSVDTLLFCPQLGVDKPIVVDHDAYGRLIHIGFSVFAPEFKRVYNLYVCNAVERLFLEIALQKTTAERVRFLKEMGVKLLLNGYPLGNPMFSSYERGIKMIDESNRINVEEDEGSFAFVVTTTEDNEMRMIIPKDRELIFGTDKKEQDEVLDLRLRTSLPYQLTPLIPSDKEVKPLCGRADVWHLPGRTFLIDSLRSDLYFSRVEGNLVPLFTPSSPCESFCNVLLGQISRPDYLLDLTHKMYGLSIPKFNILLSDFIGQMRQEQASFYASVRLIEGGTKLSGLLLISQEQFKYIHLLTVTLPVEQLFAEAPVLKAYLYTNVPQHNIMDLFR